MATDNVITITGNLADDPELRFTPNGTAVTTMRVAVNQRFKNDAGEWDDRLDGFFPVVVWRDHAENIASSLTKGARVVVVGRLRSRSYENQEGDTRWITEIQADEVAPSLRWATATIERTGRSGGRADAGAPHPADAPAPEDVPF